MDCHCPKILYQGAIANYTLTHQWADLATQCAFTFYFSLKVYLSFVYITACSHVNTPCLSGYKWQHAICIHSG